MSASPNSPSNLTIDGTNYLTCPGSNGAKATLKPLFLSYNANAKSQVWELVIPDETKPGEKQIKCTLSDGKVFYLAGSGTENAILTVSTAAPTNAHWSIAGGVISLVMNDGSATQYANQSGVNPIESSTSVDWKFETPIAPIDVNTMYTFNSDGNNYLTADPVEGQNAKLTPTEDTMNSQWKITGTIDRSTGTITDAHIVSESGWYIYGLHADHTLKCFNAKNDDYKWTVQDNGDGTANFDCHHTVDNVDTYLDADGTNPVMQLTSGRPGQKWKYRKALSSTGMGLPA